jgi:hypothetical protein
LKTHHDHVKLPTARRGRRSASQQAEHDANIEAFARLLEQKRSTLDFTPGSRGWCYLLEQAEVIAKGEFPKAERIINDLRKSGRLPIDFCASDEKRQPANLEDLDDESPEDYADLRVQRAIESWKWYEPVSFWAFQDCYVEMAVEKIDLRTLFEDVCAEYHVPIWNAGGWSDINSRADLLKRFRKANAADKHCVLLYCGDFDPAGLQISDFLRKNLLDLEKAVKWSPTIARLTIERFGLNHDFIVTNSLTWIDGLGTGGGKYNLEDPRHPDHWKPYVQDYLVKYSARKVEANALVTIPDVGRELCRNAILNFIDLAGIVRYEEELETERAKVKQQMPGALRRALENSV